MNRIQFGCQTYTWQMSYDKYSDAIDSILDTVASAQFAGLEAEVCMLGRYQTEPERLAEAFARRSLAFGALCLVCDWRHPRETDAERAEADRVIEFLRHFPGTLLALCQMPGADRTDLHNRQQNCLRCCHEVARRAAAAGIVTAFHPNSPPGSVFRHTEDYRFLLDHLDARVLGFAPDAGHIAKGGIDPVELFRQAAPLIRHVHYKDMTAAGAWAEMGRGSIDFPAITRSLRNHAYKGWIMIEDESPLAETDPAAVTRLNGEYIRAQLHALPPVL